MRNEEKKKIVEKVLKYIQEDMAEDYSGHDFWHAWRVWRLACHLCKTVKVDRFTVELAALLHDCADWKFNDGDLDAGPREAGRLLRRLGVDKDRIHEVQEIIRHISFKGEGVKPEPMSPEGEVVQDADHLDSIGAIGAARTFAYGGAVGREIYNPNQEPLHFRNFAQYKNNHSSSINHFYERSLLMRDMMHTAEAKRIARYRHKYMERYLSEFMAEWNLEA